MRSAIVKHVSSASRFAGTLCFKLSFMMINDPQEGYEVV